ncbi:AraC family transcriptional regulator [Paenibacillus mucilaginosus]|uniref:Transcriptional regulator, AraC family n=2 Tax=Paenibacillus mucilaginosus TaxID=61624 RepID=F8FD83_PAEMK|nr:transcriptional regulator, AraC family [Paenibacillus mucilaginosus KNP414]WDM30717.1 AraC family transcriptional regulator [Paenibacillus mucilaginosus]
MLMNSTLESTQLQQTAAVNRAVDYIESRFPATPTLNEVAAAVSVSPYHLHRLFKAVTGETLHGFASRVKLQRAIHRLVYWSSASATEIAYDCGYSSMAVFSRAFKGAAGVSPSDFRAAHALQNSKICKADSSLSQRYSGLWTYNGESGEHKGNGRRLKVAVREFAPAHLIYIRHYGEYAAAQPHPVLQMSFARLNRLANAMELWSSTAFLMGIAHGPWTRFPLQRGPCDAALAVPAAAREVLPRLPEEFGVRPWAGGTYAVVHFEGAPEDADAVADTLLGEWLPDSGYVYDDRPAAVVTYNNPYGDPEGRWVVDLCLPLRLPT